MKKRLYIDSEPTKDKFEIMRDKFLREAIKQLRTDCKRILENK